MERTYYGEEGASSLSTRRRNLAGAVSRSEQRFNCGARRGFIGATSSGFVQSLEFLLRLSQAVVVGPTAMRISARKSSLCKSNKRHAISNLLVVSPTMWMGWTLSSVHVRDTREIFCISALFCAHNSGVAFQIAQPN